MKTLQKTLGLTAAFALALPAFGMIELNADGSVKTESKADASASEMRVMNLTTTSASNTARVDTDLTELELNSQAEVGVEAQSGIQTNNDGDYYMNANADTVAQNNGRAQVSLALFGTDDNVMLQNKAEAMLTNNPNVSAVIANDDAVEVSYSEPVVILGLFSGEMERKATVYIDENSDIEVQVSKPWWSFMVTSNTKASADVESDIKAYAEANASSRTDVNTYARIMTAIETAFGAMVDASAQLSTDADANLESNLDADMESRIRTNTDGNIDTNLNQKLQADSEIRTSGESDIRY